MSRDDSSTPVTYADRLLAEAVRLQEGTGPSTATDEAAVKAVEAGGALEERIARRARLLPGAPALWTSLEQIRRAALTAVAAGLLAAAVAGMAAAPAALGTSAQRPVNFFWALFTLLGLQTVILLIWMLIILTRPRMLGSSSIGGLLLTLGERLAGWLHRGPHQLSALGAISAVFAGSPVGKWTLSAISHTIWIAFNLGALVALLALLSAKHYSFAWETTILSERAYVPLTRVISTLPRAVGFDVPSEAQVSRSKWTGSEPPPVSDDAAEEAWSGLLLGSLIVYGLAPRLLLAGLCLVGRWRSQHRYRLDTSRPGFRRLHERLMPASRSLGVVDGDERPIIADAPDGAMALAPERSIGPPAIIGFEIAPPQCPWPPPIPDHRFVDLGRIDDRADRMRVLSELGQLEHEPQLLLVVCELTATPDRGAQRFLAQLSRSVRRPIAVLLTAGDRLRHRISVEHLALRVQDWRAVAESAGVRGDHVLEVDLDHCTESSLRRVAQLLGPANGIETRTERHLEAAFGLVLDAATRWRESPEPSACAELHGAIAALYRQQGTAWKTLLRLPRRLNASEIASTLRGSAGRMIEILPGRLRASPKWMTAGALSGALACVAAASLVSPVAIGALPVWSALGAAVAAAARLSHGGSAREERDEEPESDESQGAAERMTAVRSAALFAVLLELQGRSEASISRVLEATFADETESDGSIGAVRAWLDETRHRFDMALAKDEASP